MPEYPKEWWAEMFPLLADKSQNWTTADDGSDSYSDPIFDPIEEDEI